jgi:peptide/nickel transport system substrate-binding protein
MIASLLASCGPTPEPEIVEVEKVVTEVVEVEKVVTEVVEKVMTEVVEVEKIVTEVVEVEKIVEVTPEPEPAIQPSGEVVIAVAIEPVSMDAWRAFGETGAPGFRSVVEQLVALDFGTGDIRPLLATSWERLDDKTIRFKLREGVTFHDGSPFNAEAAAASINWTFDEENAFDLLDFLGPMSAEAVDEYTLDVSTPEQDPLLLQKMEFVAISSGKQLAEDPDSYHTTLIGTGPYKFAEWNKGESLVYEANPEWWGIANPADARGAISFEKGTYRVLAEDQVRTASVLADEVDIAQFVTPEQCQTIEDNGGTHCISAPSVETIFIRMDTNSPMLRDVRVRKALQLAIDKELIIETLLGGAATPAGQIVNATAAGHNPDLAPYPYDPEYAKFLLSEAQADGIPVDMEITLGARTGVFAGIEEVMQAVANMLTEVGFSVTTQFYDPEAFGQVMLVNIKDVPEDRNFVGIHLHGNEILDFATSYNYYYSCDGILSVYCNEEAEQLWLDALPMSGDARDKQLQELNKVLYDDYPVGYIGHLDLAYGVSDELDWRVDLDHRLYLKEMSPAP